MGVDWMFQYEEEQREKRVQKRIDDATKNLQKKIAAYESVLREIDTKCPFIDVVNMVVKAKQKEADD